MVATFNFRETVQSLAPFVVMNGQENIVSEHAEASEAVKALAAYFAITEDEGARILQRQGRTWQVY